MFVEKCFVDISERLAAHEASIENENVEFLVVLDGLLEELQSARKCGYIGLNCNGVAFAASLYFLNDRIGRLRVVDVLS